MAQFHAGDFVRFKPGHIKSRETDIVLTVESYLPETQNNPEQIMLMYEQTPVSTDHIYRCDHEGRRIGA